MKPTVTIDSSQRTFKRARKAAQIADASEPRASTIRYSRTRSTFVIELRNGISIAIPRRLLQGVAEASPADAARVTLVDRGAALHWPTLDVDLSIAGLVRGIFGSKMWMSELGRAGGLKRSEARAQASRANGRRGGRPRKAPAPA